MFLISVKKIEFAFLFVLLIGAIGKGDREDSEEGKLESSYVDESDEVAPPGMQKLTFKAANLTEEDQHSGHMPQELMCDGCRVIAYLMMKKLDKIQSRYKKRKGYKLSESDLIDILDEVCHDEDSFNGYGVKEVKGKKRLSGEGLETKNVPGVMAGGGKWPHRLQEMCEQYVGHLGEDVIYAAFMMGGNVEKLLCYSEENGNVCDRKKKKKTSSKSKEEL